MVDFFVNDRVCVFKKNKIVEIATIRFVEQDTGGYFVRAIGDSGKIYEHYSFERSGYEVITTIEMKQRLSDLLVSTKNKLEEITQLISYINTNE